MEVSRKELQQWQLCAQHLTHQTDSLAAGSHLCGLQAQYAANALHSLRLRSGNDDIAGFVKSWTLRGTLHLFPISDLPLYIPYIGIDEIFNTDYGRWLYDGHCAVPKERMLYFARLVSEALCDTPISRDTLKDLCRANGMTESEEERVFSGWGGVIRLLAESGVLCISAQVNRAYLRVPVQSGITREQARQELMRRYIAHYGPVTLHDATYFFRWPQKNIQEMLDILQARKLLFDGRTYYYLEQPCSPPPVPRCIFLAGFDPLLLGYEKTESLYLPSEHRKKIFNNTGIVFPALLMDGKVCGKWKLQPRYVDITLFEPLNKTQLRVLEAECLRLWPGKSLKMVPLP